MEKNSVCVEDANLLYRFKGQRCQLRAERQSARMSEIKNVG